MLLRDLRLIWASDGGGRDTLLHLLLLGLSAPLLLPLTSAAAASAAPGRWGAARRRAIPAAPTTSASASASPARPASASSPVLPPVAGASALVAGAPPTAAVASAASSAGGHGSQLSITIPDSGTGAAMTQGDSCMRKHVQDMPSEEAHPEAGLPKSKAPTQKELCSAITRAIIVNHLMARTSASQLGPDSQASPAQLTFLHACTLLSEILNMHFPLW